MKDHTRSLVSIVIISLLGGIMGVASAASHEPGYACAFFSMTLIAAVVIGFITIVDD